MHAIDPGLLAELATKHPIAEVVADARHLVEETAAALRAFFHPKQAAFYRYNRAAPRRATRKTRRAGATAGGVRELIARAVEISGFRATYVATTRIEAKERAWESDTQSGFADVLRQFGTPVEQTDIETLRLGGVNVEVRVGELALEFSNGSRIDLFGADNMRALRKKRGVAKHVFWIDEAQDFPFLDTFYKAVVSAALTDKVGECWITGTPGRDCAGFFYEITQQDEPGIPGWEVHAIAQVDNPFFGAVIQTDDAWYVDDNRGVRHGPFVDGKEAEEAAIKIRWENTAGEAIRENQWKEDDPDLRREWFAEWVKGDARYVYPVHGVAAHVLVYAPQRLVDNPLAARNSLRYGHLKTWYDHKAALADLPINRRAGRHYQWFFTIGSDYGWYPDPFAAVLWAFTQELPDIWEMFSWKSTKILPDDQAFLLADLLAQSGASAIVGDPAGKQADFEAWSERFNLEVAEADKHGRNSWEEFMANDIRAERVHYREGSPLLNEHRHLVYLPGKPGRKREVDKHRAVGGVVHGDDCSMGGLYGYRHLTHHLHRPPQEQKPSTPEQRLEQDRQRYEKAVDKADERMRREREEAELEARWGIPDRPSEEEEMYGY